MNKHPKALVLNPYRVAGSEEELAELKEFYSKNKGSVAFQANVFPAVAGVVMAVVVTLLPLPNLMTTLAQYGFLTLGAVFSLIFTWAHFSDQRKIKRLESEVNIEFAQPLGSPLNSMAKDLWALPLEERLELSPLWTNALHSARELEADPFNADADDRLTARRNKASEVAAEYRALEQAVKDDENRNLSLSTGVGDDSDLDLADNCARAIRAGREKYLELS